ncbi:MAG: hypothetical protein K0S71_1369 [Clostridia bacterium]|jgi:hypothetical protein|nr:hypothetical protein [Clostridia bacterium]
MLFDKRLITCKSKQDNEVYTHIVEYHKAASKIENVHYQIVKKVMEERAVIVDIDTTLFAPNLRLNPTEYVEKLKQKLADYGIEHKISRSKKEVLDAGIGKIFSMKASKVDVAYRIGMYFTNEQFSFDHYKELLGAVGYRICILKEDSNKEDLLELFYSGMIDDLDFADSFYAHFYCHEQLTQLQVMTRYIDEEKMKRLLADIV